MSNLRQGLKWLGGLAAALVLLIGGGLLFLDQTLGSGMCETTVYSEARASNGLIARVQMTDCGATTGYSRIVMVEEPGIWSRECRAFAVEGEPTVAAAWSDKSLRITHNAAPSDVIASAGTCFGQEIKIIQEA